jgi:hypothetical protein
MEQRRGGKKADESGNPREDIPDDYTIPSLNNSFNREKGWEGPRAHSPTGQLQAAR